MATKLPTGYYRRGNIIWCRTDPATKEQISTKCKDVKALKAWTRERERLAEDPHYAAAQAARLDVWIAKTIDSKVAGKEDEAAKKVMKDFYKFKLGHFARIWGIDCALANIQPKLCDAYWEKRQAEGTADHTVCKEFSCLREMLHLAHRGGCYDGDIDALQPPNLTAHYKARDRLLTIEQIQKLFDVCNPKLSAFIIVGLCTGGRRSEILKFSKADLTETLAIIHGTKTVDSKRDIPILEPFGKLLKQALPHVPICYPNNVNRDLLAACERAGIPRISPNDLRRTFSSLLLAAGVPKEVVWRLLGHTSATMLDRVYGKLSADDLRAMADPALRAMGTADSLPRLQQLVVQSGPSSSDS